MADSDIRQFVYYDQYIWQAADFTNLQTWVFDTALGVGEGISGLSILSGLAVLPAGGLNVQVNPGIAASPSQIMVVPNAVQVTLPSPIGNPAKNLVVLRPTVIDATFIPQPTNPIVNVPLHKKQSYTVVVIAGVPAVNPSYPATQAGDVVLMGVILPAAAASLNQTNLDRTPISTPRQKLWGIASMSGASGSAASGDLGEDIIEVDASGAASAGFALVLPSSVSYAGRKKSIVKVDSSALIVKVQGQGGDLISGQSQQILESQWDTLEVYSTGLAWRVL